MRVRALGDRAAAAGAGVRPARSGAVSPSASAFLSAATRTMKNSSRLQATMQANFSRSSSGFVASQASSSTRSLNSSQDSSRFRNSSGSRRRGFMRTPRPAASRKASLRPKTSISMSARASGGQALDREVAAAVDLEHPLVLLAQHAHVAHLLQVVGVERVGHAQDRRQLVDAHAVLRVERHVGQVRLVRGRAAVVARDVGDDAPCRRGSGRRSRRPRGCTASACGARAG